MMWRSANCFEVTVHQILAELHPFECFFFILFQTSSTYSLYPEHGIVQESVYVLHHITCHERMMPPLAELFY